MATKERTIRNQNISAHKRNAVLKTFGDDALQHRNIVRYEFDTANDLRGLHGISHLCFPAPPSFISPAPPLVYLSTSTTGQRRRRRASLILSSASALDSFALGTSRCSTSAVLTASSSPFVVPRSSSLSFVISSVDCVPVRREKCEHCMR